MMHNGAECRRRHFPVAGLALASIGFFFSLDSTLADSWPPQKVIELVAARESAIRTVDAIVIREYGPGPEWKQGYEALGENRRAVARFLKLRAEKPEELKIPPVQIHKYHVQLDSTSGRLRLDETMGSEQAVFRSMYFDGSLWQTQYPGYVGGPKASVYLDASLHEPAMLQAVGLRGSLLWLGATTVLPFRTTSLPLSQYLRELHAAGLVTAAESLKDAKLGPVVVVTFIEPSTVNIRQPKGFGQPSAAPAPIPPGSIGASENRGSLAEQANQSMCHEVRLLLDPARGFMPRRAEGRSVFRGENGGWQEPQPPFYWSVDWEEPVEVVEDIWLPTRASVEGKMGVWLPKGNEFVPRMEDGKPLKIGGHPVPDIDAMRMPLFSVGRVNFRFSQIAVNKPLREPLFPNEFPAGTVVEDRTKGEVYQLTGVGPAVNATLKTVIDSIARSPTVIRHDNTSRLWWLIGANLVVLLLVATIYVLWRVRRSRRIIHR